MGLSVTKTMGRSSINFADFKIDIVVHNIEGAFTKIFDTAFPKGYWVLLTIHNKKGEKETFPCIDESFKIKIYSSYEEAIDDIAILLKKHFH